MAPYAAPIETLLSDRRKKEVLLNLCGNIKKWYLFGSVIIFKLNLYFI